MSVVRATDRGRLRASLAALIVCVMGGVGLAQPALALKPPHYSAHVYKGPPGSRGTFLAISADGTAVGQLVLADGTTHAIRLSPAKQGGRSPFAGYQSSLVAIDASDEAVGTVFGAGFSHPVLLKGSKVTTLQVSGTAVAIALGPLVAVQGYVSGDVSTHVLVWNPTTGSLRDLGQGFATGINATGIVVGQTLGGQAAYWTADGALHNLGFAGTLTHINFFGQAVGFALRSGPGQGTTPIMLDLNRLNVVTTLKLPPGWPYGIPKDISDSGLIVGDAFKDRLALTSEAVLWASPTKPGVRLQTLVRGHGLGGFQLTDAEGVDANGLIVGSVTPNAHHKASAAANAPQEYPVGFLPVPAYDKLGWLLYLVSEQGSYLGNKLHDSKGRKAAAVIFTMIQEADYLLRAGHRHAGCVILLAARGKFRRLNATFGANREVVDTYHLLKVEDVKAVDEVRGELGC